MLTFPESVSDFGLTPLMLFNILFLQFSTHRSGDRLLWGLVCKGVSLVTNT